MTITAKEIRFALDGVITELKNVATTSDLAAIVAESASKYITEDQAKESLDAAIADAMSEIKGKKSYLLRKQISHTYICSADHV